MRRLASWRGRGEHAAQREPQVRCDRVSGVTRAGAALRTASSPSATRSRRAPPCRRAGPASSGSGPSRVALQRRRVAGSGWDLLAADVVRQACRAAQPPEIRRGHERHVDERRHEQGERRPQPVAAGRPVATDDAGSDAREQDQAEERVGRDDRRDREVEQRPDGAPGRAPGAVAAARRSTRRASPRTRTTTGRAPAPATPAAFPCPWSPPSTHGARTPRPGRPLARLCPVATCAQPARSAISRRCGYDQPPASSGDSAPRGRPRPATRQVSVTHRTRRSARHRPPRASSRAGRPGDGPGASRILAGVLVLSLVFGAGLAIGQSGRASRGGFGSQPSPGRSAVRGDLALAERLRSSVRVVRHPPGPARPRLQLDHAVRRGRVGRPVDCRPRRRPSRPRPRA